MKKLFIISASVLYLSTIFTSCGPGSKENEAINASDADTNDIPESSGMTKTKSAAQNIFYAIPSPIELAQLIQKAGAKYNKDILNPPTSENIAKYTTNTSKALNLGIYGADLSYTGVFDNNTQETILYISASRKLAEALGVGNAFTESTVNRIQSNTGKKDSVLSIISDSYMSTDEILKESEREGVSALVITGGFVEALYLGTQLSGTIKNNQGIISRIAEQKGTLDNVISLLNVYQGDNTIAPILEEIKSLKTIYDEVKVSSDSSSPQVKTNLNTKVTAIGGKINYEITPETLKALTAKTAEIRNKITGGQIN